jgi:spore maturation protein CgeB
MKILMSHSKNTSLLAPQYFEAFKQMGILAKGIFHTDHLETLAVTGKIAYRLFPKLWWDAINEDLIHQANEFIPDIILIFKGMEIYPKTLVTLRKKGILLVNYNPDHPYDYVSRGSGNQNVLNSIEQYHTYITYSDTIASDFRRKYPEIPIVVLPFGYSLTDAEYQEISNETEIKRTCFIGYADRQRALVIESLLKQDIAVDVYGPGWSSFFNKNVGGLNIRPSVSGVQYYRHLRRYRVQLNLFRNHNAYAHNMRSFEVPAAGGIMLAPDTVAHRSFFEADKEVFLYNSESEIPEKVQEILQLSDEKASVIRENARIRSVESGYDYPSRAVALLNILRNITH